MSVRFWLSMMVSSVLSSAVLADQPRRHPLDEFEARPPHQRAVAEDPEVVGSVLDSGDLRHG